MIPCSGNAAIDYITDTHIQLITCIVYLQGVNKVLFGFFNCHLMRHALSVLIKIFEVSLPSVD